MTVLFGDSTFSTYSAAGPNSGDGGYLSAIPFICADSGVITNLYCYLNPDSPSQFQMALYDATGQLLQASAPITVQPSQGLTPFPIKSTSVRQFQGYQIVLIPLGAANTFTFGTDTGVFSNAFKVNITSPQYQLPAPEPVGFQQPTFFADGSATAQFIQPSGKIGQTILDVATVINLAFRRCKLRPNTVSDEMIEVARQELFLLLTSDLANRGEQLFAIDTQLLPMTAGLAGLETPVGTVDVLNANYRYMSNIQSGPVTTFTPTSPVAVTTVGLTWAGPATAILIQMSQDNVNWQTLKAVTPDASLGDVTLYDLDGSVASPFWQVIADPVLSEFPLMVSQVTFYTTLSQTPMAPYSRDDFANLSDTFFTGRPFQYWLDRQDPWPIMRLWPTPQTNDQNNACIIIWRKRQIMDVGAMSDRLDVPNRWLTAVIDMLAFRLAKSIDEVPLVMAQYLKVEADESLRKVREEERENAPLRIIPQLYCYTR